MRQIAPFWRIAFCLIGAVPEIPQGYRYSAKFLPAGKINLLSRTSNLSAQTRLFKKQGKPSLFRKFALLWQYHFKTAEKTPDKLGSVFRQKNQHFSRKTSSNELAPIRNSSGVSHSSPKTCAAIQ